MQYLGFFLLQQQAAPGAQSNPLMSFLPLIFIVAIFYFLVFMPMQKQKKQQAQMLSSLQAGTDVLTTGGIVGTIVSLTDTTLILRVKPDNIKLQVMRSAVASLVDPSKQGGEEKK
ncbi:MAG TPA: preprotein translocase subunit YajC [Bryobacteraceae bacterium]|nr:preprotein translocase subunit YajC [Bryobacteraceae bacterium]